MKDRRSSTVSTDFLIWSFMFFSPYLPSITASTLGAKILNLEIRLRPYTSLFGHSTPSAHPFVVTSRNRCYEKFSLQCGLLVYRRAQQCSPRERELRILKSDLFPFSLISGKNRSYLTRSWNTTQQVSSFAFLCDHNHCYIPTHPPWLPHQSNGAEYKPSPSTSMALSSIGRMGKSDFA